MAAAVGLSSSPDSTSSLFLSLSAEASPFSSSVSCGNNSLNSSSNVSGSPPGNSGGGQATEDVQLAGCQLQCPQLDFLQPTAQHTGDDGLWSSFNLARPESPQAAGSGEGQVAFEAFSCAEGAFSVRPMLAAAAQNDSLHNRIFERGENFFGFTEEDRRLFLSTVGNDEDQLLLTHFPRRKLDLDLRVLQTVYIEDTSRKRQLALELRSEVPVSKLLVRTHALGLAPGETLQPCPKCSGQCSGLLASVLSHSLEGLVYNDAQRQQSTVYATGGQADCAGRVCLTLKYNCSQDHLRNSFRLGQHSLANLLTVIEAYDVMSNLIGRASYRVRVVASPARDMLRLLTNQLTPEQTGCTIGQCAHLAARWKPEKLKALPADDLRRCLGRFRVKEELRAELQAQLDSCGRLAAKRRRRFEEEQQHRQQQQQQQQQQQEQQEGMRLLEDGSVLVRVSDQRKMARIHQAVAAILAEDSSHCLQLQQQCQQQQQQQQQQLQQLPALAAPQARAVPLTLQPILVADLGFSLRPLYQQQQQQQRQQ